MEDEISYNPAFHEAIEETIKTGEPGKYHSFDPSAAITGLAPEVSYQFIDQTGTGVLCLAIDIRTSVPTHLNRWSNPTPQHIRKEIIEDAETIDELVKFLDDNRMLPSYFDLFD